MSGQCPCASCVALRRLAFYEQQRFDTFALLWMHIGILHETAHYCKDMREHDLTIMLQYFCKKLLD